MKTRGQAFNQSNEPPESFQFNLDSPATTTAASKRRKSPPSPANLSLYGKTESVSSISELKELTSSRLDSIKRYMERSHSEIIAEVQSSNSRLHKRFKIQSQACKKLMDDMEMDFKKTSEKITESCQAMKVSYAEFIAEAQASKSHVCNASIPEKAESFEKAIDVLRCRYGIPSVPA